MLYVEPNFSSFESDSEGLTCSACSKKGTIISKGFVFQMGVCQLVTTRLERDVLPVAHNCTTTVCLPECYFYNSLLCSFLPYRAQGDVHFSN